jgi:hypothetical protein
MIHHRDVAGGIWQGDGYEDWQAYYTSGNSKDNTVYFCNLKTKQVRIMRNAGHHELASCGSFIKKSSPYTFGHLIDQAEEVVEQPSVDLQFVESQDEVLRK